jgi:hypothetical protein
VGLLVITPGSVEQQSTEQLVDDVTPPNGFAMFLLSGESHSHGTLTVQWTASAPIAAELNAGTCSAHAMGCEEAVLQNWASARSGSFSISGAIGANYVLSWTTAPTITATVNASSLTEWGVATSPSLVDLVAEVAGGLLAGVGAVAMFLGLFLRGGFRGVAPMVSRSADDAAAVADATGPRTGTSGDGSGPPRRGPPSRSP